MKNTQKTKFNYSNLTRASLLLGLIFVMTAFLKMPTLTGYVHLGDGAVCIAAILLPQPLGFAVAALGSALADFYAGFPLWMLPTAIIKGAMTLAFSRKSEKILTVRNLFAVLIAVAICVSGYYLGGSIIYGNFTVCLAEIPFNIVQSVSGGVIFAVFAAFLDANPKIKNMIRGK